MRHTVLVVDDETKILAVVKAYLEKNGFDALCAATAAEGMALFQKNTVSLILLDLMLPDFSGGEFCKQVRQTSDVPIIMLTAKVEEEDIIRGLNSGADDYVTKPFSPRQLMARVQAVLRRTGAANALSAASALPQTNQDSGAEGRVFSYRDLTVDTGTRAARQGGSALALTRGEYNILALLMSRQTKIWTRDEILSAVKGDDFNGFDRSVDNHIKRLRAKIGDDSKTPRYIVTVYGMGYRLGEP